MSVAQTQPQPSIIASNLLRTNLLLLLLCLFAALLHTGLVQRHYPVFWLVQPGDAVLLLGVVAIQLAYQSGRLRTLHMLSLVLVVFCLSLYGWFLFAQAQETEGLLSADWFSVGALVAISYLVLIWLVRLCVAQRYRWFLLHGLVGASLLFLLLALLLPEKLLWLPFGFHRPMQLLTALLFAAVFANELLLEKVQRLSAIGLGSLGTFFSVAVLTCAVSLWWYLHQLESRTIQHQSSYLVEQMLLDNQHEITHYNLLIQRMAERLSALGLEQQTNFWQLDASAYFRDYAALQHLAIITEAEEDFINQGRTETQAAWYQQRILSIAGLQQKLMQQESSQLHLAGPGQSRWLVLLIPFQADGDKALLVASLDLAILLKQLQRTLPGFQIALNLRTDERVYALLTVEESVSHRTNRLYRTEKPMQSDTTWQAEVYRDSEFWVSALAFPPVAVLLLGYLVAFGFMLSQCLLALTRSNRRALLASNKQLLSSMERQSELMALNEAIMQYSMDVLTIVNAKGYFIQLSDACEQVFGHSRQELMAQPFLQFVHPDDKARTQREAQKVQQGYETLNFRNRYIHKSGKVIWLMWSARWSEQSQTMFGIARDITQLVNKERISTIRSQTLQQISTNQPLKNILESICHFYQQEFAGAHCVIMQAKADQLSLVAASDLPSQVLEALNTQPIASEGGVCGLAAFCKQSVLVADIAHDVRLGTDRAALLQHGFTACWGFPLLSDKADLLGTLTIYQPKEQQVDEAEQAVIDACVQLAVLAIEREQNRRKLLQSEQRYRSLFFSNPDAIFALDLAGNFTAVNRAGCFLWQQSEMQLLGKSYVKRLPKTEQPRVLHAIALSAHGSPQTYELTLCIEPERELTLQLSHTPIHVDQQVVGMFVIAKDLTEKLRAQERLRLFQRAIEASSNGVVISDARLTDHPIVFVNKSFERITGYTKADVLGKNCRLLQGQHRDDAVAEEIKLSLQQQKECHVLIKNVRKDGRLFWNELYIAPVPDEEGHTTHFVGVQNDVTDQKSYEDELAFNASHDILTGLPNRALLHDRLLQGCRMSARSKRSLAVLFIDLDGFKLVNDTLGHLVGDHLLVDVAKRLAGLIRPGDTLARLGGDEFVLLLPELGHEDDVVLVAERILQQLNETFVIEQQELHIGASIGITISSGELDEPTQLIQQADLAMFKAKQLGHNNYQWYNTELNQALGRQLTLRTELQKAITAQEFVLHYQPQYDALSQRIIGVEALLRWTHPTMGAISPADFIPVAEDSGQIIPLSEWVLDTACCFAASLRKQGHHNLVMAVNVSSLQFQRSQFVSSIEAALQKHQLPADALELELTESVLLSQTESAIEKIQQLNQLGVSISIDDFGTGFSSLSYLKHLPLQKIKIDQSFVRDVVRDRHDAAITKAIISIAHHLQIKVIAEGVETKAQVAFLRKYHCDEFQGYYFARPMPAADLLLALLAEQSLPAEHDSERTAPNSKGLLLLDDEENILKALARVLRREAYQIYTASNAEQAFELLALHDIQVVVSDQRMPGMSGTEFLSKVKAMYPETVRLVLSGYTDLKSVTEAINEGSIYKFLTKPWDDKSLRDEIRLAFWHQEARQAELSVSSEPDLSDTDAADHSSSD